MYLVDATTPARANPSEAGKRDAEQCHTTGLRHCERRQRVSLDKPSTVGARSLCFRASVPNEVVEETVSTHDSHRHIGHATWIAGHTDAELVGAFVGICGAQTRNASDSLTRTTTSDE